MTRAVVRPLFGGLSWSELPSPTWSLATGGLVSASGQPRGRRPPWPSRARRRSGSSSCPSRSGGSEEALPEQGLERPVAVRLEQPTEAADGALADEDLRERHLARAVHEVGAALGALGEVDLLVVDPAVRQQSLRLAAEAAG